MNMKSTVRILGAVLLLAGLSACVYPGVGFDGTVGVGVDGGYGGNYYEPGGYGYGGWGGGYRVGPNRDGGRGPERGGRPFRSAAPSRRMPSLPSGSHGRP